MYKCGGRYNRLRTCEKTSIKLQDIDGYYEMVGYATEEINILDINKGDTVDVYVKKWYQYPLNWGRFKQIEYLEKNGILFYKYDRWPWVWIITGVFFLCGLFVVIYIEKNTKKWIDEGKLD